MLNSIYAPFDLGTHIIICLIATLFYGFMYFRTKKSYFFTMILAFDLTLITQMAIDQTTFYVLAFGELFLILLMIFSYVKTKKAEKEKALEEENLAEPKIDEIG